MTRRSVKCDREQREWLDGDDDGFVWIEDIWS